MRKIVSASIDEDNLQVLREKYKEWGFRNISHAIDHAVELLLEERKK